LEELDLVVLARKDADKLDNRELKDTLEALWQDLHNKKTRAAAKTQSNR